MGNHRGILLAGMLGLTPNLTFAQGTEIAVMTCYYGFEDIQVNITQRGETTYWTEADRRVAVQMIRSVREDSIVGMTANRLDGTISMLSLSRPVDGTASRRRDAALTIHKEVGETIFAETHDAHCDVEDLR